MKKLSIFEIVVTGLFGVAILGGMLIFALSHSGQSNSLPAITIWGTVSADQFNQDIQDTLAKLSPKPSITYVEKLPSEFDQELVDALASGNGPDIVLLPQNLILKYRNKIFPVPYTSYSSLQFDSSFIGEGSLFKTPQGILAFPFVVDPLMMYWNKDMFASAGIPTPSTTWDDIFTSIEQISKRTSAGALTQSGIAIGEYSNVLHAKDILSTILMQVGVPIVTWDTTGTPVVNIGQDKGANTPAVSALTFYTSFANPTNQWYAWSKSMPSSDQAFLSGDTAIYFGPGSEYPTFQKKNPNLNFGIVGIPQPKSAVNKTTFGTMLGFAIMKSSSNVTTDIQVIGDMLSQPFVSEWADVSNTAPASTAYLTADPSNAIQTAVYSSALYAKAWLDPDPTQTDQIFGRMIENVTSGQTTIPQALYTASQELGSLLQ
jgi:multiple sugar transport system substrate-binding protein